MLKYHMYPCFTFDLHEYHVLHPDVHTYVRVHRRIFPDDKAFVSTISCAVPAASLTDETCQQKCIKAFYASTKSYASS